jgi:hypothetical protein
MPEWGNAYLTPNQRDGLIARSRWVLLLDEAPIPSAAHHAGLRLHFYSSGTDAADKDAYPSIATLARIMKCSETTARAGVNVLDELGFVIVEPRPRGAGRASNRYLLAWPGIDVIAGSRRDTAVVCGMPNRHGRPCARTAGWGVLGTTTGPCMHHLNAAIPHDTRYEPPNPVPHDTRHDITAPEVPDTSRPASDTSRAGDEFEGDLIVQVHGEYDGARASHDEHEFDRWWQRYPRKIGKPSALTNWRAAIELGATPAQLTDGLAAWAGYWQAEQTEERFIPYPAKWLDQRHWDDEPPRRQPRLSKSMQNLARVLGTRVLEGADR